MGTVFRIQSRAAGPGFAEIARAAFDSVRAVDSVLSTYRPRSEVMRLARDASLNSPSPILLENVDLAGDVFRMTGGAFDPALGRGWEVLEVAPGSRRIAFHDGRVVVLDFGGSAKGDALDRALRAVPAGIDVLVDLGGQVAVRSAGRLPPQQVAVVDPTDREASIAVVELSNGSVATSATYERGEHIIDPRSGAPARGVLSVTVVHPVAGLADALATGFFVLGAERALELADSLDVAVLVVSDGPGPLNPARIGMSRRMEELAALREDLVR